MIEPNTPEVQLPDLDSMSTADFNRWRETGEQPEPAAEPENTSEADDKPAETEPDSDPDKQEKDEDEPQPDELTKKGLAKRFSKLTQARREAEARATALEAQLAKLQESRPATETAKPATEGEPKLEDFEDYTQYARAIARWEAKQTIAAERAEQTKAKEQEQVESTLKTWNTKVSEFSKQHEDYGDLIESLPPLPPVLQRAIIESEAGPALAYHVAQPQNEAQLEQLLSAVNDPLKMARMIGRIEAAIVTPPAQRKPKVSAAPEPITPVSSSKAKTFDPLDPDVPFSEWEKQRNKQAARSW